MEKNNSLSILIIINIIVLVIVMLQLFKMFQKNQNENIIINSGDSNIQDNSGLNNSNNQQSDIESNVNSENEEIQPTLAPSPTPCDDIVNEEDISNPFNYNNENNLSLPVAKKPIIYLYPQKIQDVSITLNTTCQLDITYPQLINNQWNVTAFPDGKLINKSDNREYSYLFWEGSNCQVNYNLSKGFVVKGENTKEFLQEKLAKIGLLPKEYNEFIVYWLPQMQKNKYNLIHFSQEQYQNSAKMEINPKPDSILRVFMVYKSLENPVEIQSQEFPQFIRKGFSVIEWGGTEI